MAMRSQREHVEKIVIKSLNMKGTNEIAIILY